MKSLTELMIENPSITVFYKEDPVFLNDDAYYTVGTITHNLKEHMAYIVGDYVYPYYGTIDREKLNKADTKVGIYECEKVYMVKEPKTEAELEAYSKSNVSASSVPAIWEEVTHAAHFISEEDREMISNNVKDYRPTIKPDDDPLKKIVKQAIIDKSVNVNLFKGAFEEKHGLTNIKSTLTSTSNLTMMKFLQWLEILNLNYKIEVSDNGLDQYYPLDNPLVYDSSLSQVFRIKEGKSEEIINPENF